LAVVANDKLPEALSICEGLAGDEGACSEHGLAAVLGGQAPVPSKCSRAKPIGFMSVAGGVGGIVAMAFHSLAEAREVAMLVIGSKLGDNRWGRWRWGVEEIFENKFPPASAKSASSGMKLYRKWESREARACSEMSRSPLGWDFFAEEESGRGEHGIKAWVGGSSPRIRHGR
jgi:hypothetical protein